MRSNDQQILICETDQQQLARNSAYPHHYDSTFGCIGENEIQGINPDLGREKLIGTAEEAKKLYESFYTYPNKLSEEEKRNYGYTQGIWSSAGYLSIYPCEYNSDKDPNDDGYSMDSHTGRYAFPYVDDTGLPSGMALVFDRKKPDEWVLSIGKQTYLSNKSQRKVTLFSSKGSSAHNHFGKIARFRATNKEKIKSTFNKSSLTPIIEKLFTKENKVNIKTANNMLILFSSERINKNPKETNFNSLKEKLSDILDSNELFKIILAFKQNIPSELMEMKEKFISDILDPNNELHNRIKNCKETDIKQIINDHIKEEKKTTKIIDISSNSPQKNDHEEEPAQLNPDLERLKKYLPENHKDEKFLFNYDIIRREKSAYPPLLFLINEAIEDFIKNNQDKKTIFQTYKESLFKCIHENKDNSSKLIKDITSKQNEIKKYLGSQEEIPDIIKNFSVLKLLIKIALEENKNGSFFHYFKGRFISILKSQEFEKIINAHDGETSFLPTDMTELKYLFEDLIEGHSLFYKLVKKCNLESDKDKIRIICQLKKQAEELLAVTDYIIEDSEYISFLPNSDIPKLENTGENHLCFLHVTNRKIREIEQTNPPPDSKTLNTLSIFRQDIFKAVNDNKKTKDFDSLNQAINKACESLNEELDDFKYLKQATQELLFLCDSKPENKDFLNKIKTKGESLLLLAGYAPQKSGLNFWLETQSEKKEKKANNLSTLLYELNEKIQKNNQKNLGYLREALFNAIKNYVNDGKLSDLLKFISNKNTDESIKSLLNENYLRTVAELSNSKSSNSFANIDTQIELLNEVQDSNSLFQKCMKKSPDKDTVIEARIKEKELLQLFDYVPNENLAFLLTDSRTFANSLQGKKQRRRLFLLYTINKAFQEVRKGLTEEKLKVLDECRLNLFKAVTKDNADLSLIEKAITNLSNNNFEEFANLSNNLMFLKENAQKILKSKELLKLATINRFASICDFLKLNQDQQTVQEIITPDSILCKLIKDSTADKNKLHLALETTTTIHGLKSITLDKQDEINLLNKFREQFLTAIKNYPKSDSIENLTKFTKENYDEIGKNLSVKYKDFLKNSITNLLFICQTELATKEINFNRSPPSKILTKIMLSYDFCSSDFLPEEKKKRQKFISSALDSNSSFNQKIMACEDRETQKIKDLCKPRTSNTSPPVTRTRSLSLGSESNSCKSTEGSPLSASSTPNSPRKEKVSSAPSSPSSSALSSTASSARPQKSPPPPTDPRRKEEKDNDDSTVFSNNSPRTDSSGNIPSEQPNSQNSETSTPTPRTLSQTSIPIGTVGLGSAIGLGITANLASSSLPTFLIWGAAVGSISFPVAAVVLAALTIAVIYYQNNKNEAGNYAHDLHCLFNKAEETISNFFLPTNPST